MQLSQVNLFVMLVFSDTKSSQQHFQVLIYFVKQPDTEGADRKVREDGEEHHGKCQLSIFIKGMMSSCRQAELQRQALGQARHFILVEHRCYYLFSFV